jgi:hypothetical protein
LGWVAAKGADVVAGPLKRQALVPHPLVTGGLAQALALLLQCAPAEEAQNAEAVDWCDDDALELGFAQQTHR